MTHIPVLLEEIISLVQPQSSATYIDGTLGEGGHTLSLLQHSSPNGRVLGIDLDPGLEKDVRRRLRKSGIDNTRFIFARGSFRNLKILAHNCGISRVQGIILDVGLSSRMVDDPNKGMSFRKDGPLDMRFDPDGKITAQYIIDSYTEKELARIIRSYGEERWARIIARNIVARRKDRSFTGTLDLADIIAKSIPRKFWQVGLHPATRTFQALRIAVNDELNALREALPQAIDLLVSGGVLAVISFHSLEDRIVKNFFKEESRECICPPELPICRCNHHASLRVCTKKPLIPTTNEIQINPRSRSAKLRAVEKI